MAKETAKAKSAKTKQAQNYRHPECRLKITSTLQNGEQFVVDISLSDTSCNVIVFDALSGIWPPFIRPLEFAELDGQSLFRSTNNFPLFEKADAANESSVS